MAGTADGVSGATVEWLRYQVASAAREAKAGNRSASIAPSPSRSETVGSSSSTTITTGAGSSTVTSAAAAGVVVTRGATGEANRNSPTYSGTATAT